VYCRLLPQLAIVVAFSAVCLAIACRAEGTGKERVRELEIVVTTNAETQAFAKACLQEIAGQTASALSSLSPLTAANGKAKDGAARYRLLIEHKGTAIVGKTWTVKSSFPRTKQETIKKGNQLIVRTVLDKRYFQTWWYLPAKQKGTLTFTLLKWEEGAFKSVDTWTIATVDREALRELPGRAPVASLYQDETKAKINFLPECPITPDQARDQAFAQCEPGPFENAFAARWVKGRFGKLTAKDGEVVYEVLVQNKSPWPLSRVFVESTNKDRDLSGFVEFKPAIAPGKMGKGKGSCAVVAAPKSTPGLRFTEASFEAER
jgi:hypothetical protein